MENNLKYTCADYRAEMILVGLRQRLNRADLDEKGREEIIREIDRLETDMDMN
ncbi:MAG: hypothetical protein JRE58_03695 [Deltaproteobacteria bacterium]|nr:hypothetical protein [Deltaproteobacteria bacterium]MBW2592099.1 hypothetical protein [Deltaproteobacteria bacterium]